MKKTEVKGFAHLLFAQADVKPNVCVDLKLHYRGRYRDYVDSKVLFPLDPRVLIYEILKLKFHVQKIKVYFTSRMKYNIRIF